MKISKSGIVLIEEERIEKKHAEIENLLNTQ